MPRTWSPPDEQSWSQTLSEVAGVEKMETQIAREYKQTEDEVRLLLWRMEVDQGQVPKCISDGGIFGCSRLARYPLWLIPWTELRKDGVPVGLRSEFRYWVPVCLNCLILEQAKRRKRKTAWVKRASGSSRKSPAFARSVYEAEYEFLNSMLQPHKQSVREYHCNWQENVPRIIKFQIGDPVINSFLTSNHILINIDTTRVKNEGIVTLTYS